MKIYIVRHGETDLNAKGVMQGWLDEPLNKAGRDLAEITGQQMKGIRFDYCISSPLIRAKETAEIILRKSRNETSIEYDDRIKEINFGDMEGKSLTDLKEAGKPFFADPLNFIGFPNGESVQMVMKRTQEFLKELAAKDNDKTYLEATHGGALRAMLNFFVRG